MNQKRARLAIVKKAMTISSTRSGVKDEGSGIGTSRIIVNRV